MFNEKRVNYAREEMEKAVTKYVSAYNGHAASQEELKALKKSADTKVTQYNMELSKDRYKEWAAAGDAVRTAIRERVIRDAQKVVYKTDNETDTKTASYKNVDYDVNLPMMQATIGADKFADANWFSRIEKLAYLLANRIAAEVGNKTTFRYNVSEMASAFEFESGCNMKDIKSIAKALQVVFDSIVSDVPTIKAEVTKLDDGTPVCYAWTYIKESMTKRGIQRGTLEIGNTGLMTALIADAMHQLMTSADFGAVAGDEFSFPKSDEEIVAGESTESEEE